MSIQNDWKTEIIKKMPWSATFLVASFLFFKYTNYEIVAWICFVVATIALFLVIRFEYYEKIIDRQEKQIKQYSKQALDSQVGATKAISDMNTSVVSSLSNYKNNSDDQTKTE
jgi:hypothetical protein